MPAGSASEAGAAARTRPGPPQPSGRQRPDIYRWLPFSQSGLARAAGIASRFTADYDTFSYTENAAGYLAPMRGIIDPTLALQLTAAYDTPGVARLRALGKQVATGTAVITSLRDFGPSSITFLITGTEHLADTRGRSRLSSDYAITVARTGGAWRVAGIELVSAVSS